MASLRLKTKVNGNEMMVRVVSQIAPPAFARAGGGVPVGESCVQVICVVHVAGATAAGQERVPRQRSFLTPFVPAGPFVRFPPKSSTVLGSTATTVMPVRKPMVPAGPVVRKFESAHETTLFCTPLLATPAYSRQPEASFAGLPAIPGPGTIASPPTSTIPATDSPFCGCAAVESGTA